MAWRRAIFFDLDSMGVLRWGRCSQGVLRSSVLLRSVQIINSLIRITMAVINMTQLNEVRKYWTGIFVQ